MVEHTAPVRRRTVLRTIGASAVAGSAFIGISGAQSTITVPGDESTIEDAIDAATPGDTIEVEPGTYDED